MEERIIDRLVRTGRLATAESGIWGDACSLLQVLDVIAKEGATIVVKLDGERQADRYTVIVSGGQLQGNAYRGDGDDLRALLDEAVREYDAKVWQLQLPGGR